MSEGAGAHWHLRNVALRAERWVAAEVADASDGRREGLREQFAAAFEAARAFADSSPGALAEIEGADHYLGGLAGVTRLARRRRLDDAAIADLLGWHARSVETFNAMVVIAKP